MCIFNWNVSIDFGHSYYVSTVFISTLLCINWTKFLTGLNHFVNNMQLSSSNEESEISKFVWTDVETDILASR